MTAMTDKPANDPDGHKGAIEGDRPSDEQNVDNRHERRRRATACRTIRSRRRRIAIGANEDESRGAETANC